MSKAIVITKDTSIAGVSVTAKSVLLVPQECSHDDARDLMRMKRAEEADESQAKKRLGEYKKKLAEREAKEEAEREAAEAAAKAELGELEKLQQEILEDAKAEAESIVNAAKDEAKQILAVAGAGVMRAKMELLSVDKHGDKSETLKFSAVGKSEAYPDDGLDEDNTFATFTPSAELTILVNNPALAGKMKKGETFYLDFTKVTKAK